jgi:hypothetical protein
MVDAWRMVIKGYGEWWLEFRGWRLVVSRFLTKKWSTYLGIDNPQI